MNLGYGSRRGLSCDINVLLCKGGWVCELRGREEKKKKKKRQSQKGMSKENGGVVAVGKGIGKGDGGGGGTASKMGAVMGAAWRHASLPPPLGLVILSCQMKSCN